MRTVHELKIEDVYFDQINDGAKKFEVRYNDRGYQNGDHIIFLDTYGSNRFNSGLYEIIYIHSGLGMKEYFVVLGIMRIDIP